MLLAIRKILRELSTQGNAHAARTSGPALANGTYRPPRRRVRPESLTYAAGHLFFAAQRETIWQ